MALLSGRNSNQFQSTLPARGATRGRRGIPPRPHHFNPRSPHGERRGGGDGKNFGRRFQSTLPARGATTFGDTIPPQSEISIHAPRTGSDTIRARTSPAMYDFNPRSPHGERPNPPRRSPARRRFQSTLPARGATSWTKAVTVPDGYFNPRSPHGERQFVCWGVIQMFTNFNPRSPHGERPWETAGIPLTLDFNPRSPHGERRARA